MPEAGAAATCKEQADGTGQGAWLSLFLLHFFEQARGIQSGDPVDATFRHPLGASKTGGALGFLYQLLVLIPAKPRDFPSLDAFSFRLAAGREKARVWGCFGCTCLVFMIESGIPRANNRGTAVLSWST